YESDGRMNYGKQVIVNEIDFPNAKRAQDTQGALEGGKEDVPDLDNGGDFMDVPEDIEEELPFV
ncbi:MAG: single-stranded DNA-binding protein, partial [bacterium]